MKKQEFLRELENSLKGKLSETDLKEVLSDYNDIFEDGILVTSGILNLISFILGCATPDHKTLHDLVAKTKVINIKE